MKRKLQKIDLTGKQIYVGLDVHKRSWYTTIIFGDIIKQKSFSAESEHLYKYLSREYPGADYHIAYEAGFSGFWPCEDLNNFGCKTIVVNPADIPTSDKDERNKTDKKDSKKIAMSLKGGLLEGIYVPTRQEQEDRSLLRRRMGLVKQQTRVKNQIKAHLCIFKERIPEKFEDSRTHWSKNFIKALEEMEFTKSSGKEVLLSYLRDLDHFKQQIKDITKKIRELTKLEKYNENFKILTSVPGFGLVTSATMLTEIIDIKRFSNFDNFVSFVGLCPTERSSGEKQKIGHMTKRRSNILRNYIIEATWTAIRHDPALGSYYNERKQKIGSQKAIIKTARKLLSRVYYLLNSGEHYVKGVS
jgi:transposase